MTDRITRNRKGIMKVNGIPVRVSKTACYTDIDVLQYVEKCAERAPSARWDFSMMGIPQLNRVAEAKGISH